VIILVAPLMVAADQFSKLVIHSSMRPYDSITVIPGYLNFYYVRNSGLVFGMFSGRIGAFSAWVFLGITIVALAIIIRLFFSTEDKAVLLPLALSLVLAGALGNLIDRFHWGYVVDFVQVYFISKSPPYREYSWGIFNVADIAISTGIGFLLIDSFRPHSPVQSEVAGRPDSGVAEKIVSSKEI
jgi:signal peptidase II